MRNFQTLDTVTIDNDTGILTITAANQSTPEAHIAVRREGEYVAIAASYGPLEIAQRPRYEELQRTLARLKPIDGLQTARQLGTSQVYISFGLWKDSTLAIRPTLVGDAFGHIVFNFKLTPEARIALYEWLGIQAGE